jgi:hypothetical protein
MMKIRTKYYVEEGLYYANLSTEDWSEKDLDLIARFGDSEVDTYGVITLFPAVTASGTGASGNTFTDTTHSWDINYLVGRTVLNVTQSTSGTVISNTATVITTNIAWTVGDTYTFTAVTYDLGTADDQFVRMKSDSPFLRAFDTRDFPIVEGTLVTARTLANGWAYTMLGRISDARQTLIDKNDSYTREEIATYE